MQLHRTIIIHTPEIFQKFRREDRTKNELPNDFNYFSCIELKKKKKKKKKSVIKTLTNYGSQ